MTLPQFNWCKPNKDDTLQAYHYDTAAGQLILITQGSVLCKIEWRIVTATQTIPHAISKELQQQIDHYWLSPSINIMLPLLHQGTAFQHSVWQALRQIPLGHTRTYGELARELNTSPRALANACRNNPFPLIIPCHRVLAKTGIGGYAGAVSGKLINIKKTLLQHEQLISDEF